MWRGVGLQKISYNKTRMSQQLTPQDPNTPKPNYALAATGGIFTMLIFFLAPFIPETGFGGFIIIPIVWIIGGVFTKGTYQALLEQSRKPTMLAQSKGIVGALGVVLLIVLVVLARQVMLRNQ